MSRNDFKSHMDNKNNTDLSAFKQRKSGINPNLSVKDKINKLQKDLLTLSIRHVKSWHDTSDNDNKLKSSEDLRILKAISETLGDHDTASGISKAASKLESGISADALINLLFTRDGLYNIPKI